MLGASRAVVELTQGVESRLRVIHIIVAPNIGSVPPKNPGIAFKKCSLGAIAPNIVLIPLENLGSLLVVRQSHCRGKTQLVS